MENVIMKNVIKCPYCGCEYLPSEIFMPNEFLGKPKNIYKNLDGKIESYDGVQSLEEYFCCDVCNKNFKVAAHISFNSEKYEVLNFDDEYESPLYGDRITLEEN